MIFAQLADGICCASALLVPAYIVLRSPRWLFTIPLGALIFWFAMRFDNYLLSVLAPPREGITAERMWAYLGWRADACVLLFGSIYASGLYALRRLFLYLREI